MRALLFSFPLCVMLSGSHQAAAQVPGGDAASSGAADRAAEQILDADASRPGDADLTCEQIGVELQGIFAGMADMQTMLSSAKYANEEVNKTQAELEGRQATEAPALQAAAGRDKGCGEHVDEPGRRPAGSDAPRTAAPPAARRSTIT